MYRHWTCDIQIIQRWQSRTEENSLKNTFRYLFGTLPKPEGQDPQPNLTYHSDLKRSDGQRGTEPVLWGKAKGAKSFLPGECLRGPHHSIPVQKGWLQGQRRLSLHKERHREDMGQQVQDAPEEVLSQHNKDTFYNKNSNSLEQPPQGCGKCIIAGFEDVLGNLLQAHFPVKSLTRWSFKVPFNLGCSMILW